MTLNDLEPAGPSFDDERACVELTLGYGAACWIRYVADVLSCLIREAGPRGPSGTPVTRDVTDYSAGVDIHSASAQSPVQLISAHFRRCGAEQLII